MHYSRHKTIHVGTWKLLAQPKSTQNSLGSFRGFASQSSTAFIPNPFAFHVTSFTNTHRSPMPLSRKSLSTGAHRNHDGPHDCAPARRLIRQRKLRHLSDHDIGFFFFHSADSSSSSSAPPEPRSHCASDHRSLSYLPQPLPLPEAPLTRRASSVSPGSANPPLSSSLEHRSFSSSG